MIGIRDVQIAGKILFLDVSMRVFSEEIIIWSGTRNNEDPPSPMWMLSNPSRVQTEWNTEEGWFHFLFFSWAIHLYLPLNLGVPGSQAIRFELGPRFIPLAPLVLIHLGLGWNYTTWASSFQTTNVWDFSVSIFSWASLP